MAFTQSQVDALRDAIASGALTVHHANKTVTYRSLEEMRETLALMESELAGASAAARVGFVGFKRDHE